MLEESHARFAGVDREDFRTHRLTCAAKQIEIEVREMIIWTSNRRISMIRVLYSQRCKLYAWNGFPGALIIVLR